MLPRRSFLYLGGVAAIASYPLFAGQKQKSDIPLVDQVPSMLDHILLGCSDLQAGIAFVEQHTGVRAAFGGVHPGRGTQNAILSLSASTAQGLGRYLEIIAPDPKQDRVEQEYARAMVEHLRQLTSPALVGWAAHTHNIEAFAATLKSERITFGGPYPGSRKRPDGKTLEWKTLNLRDDVHGLLPFFIEWGKDSIHPSNDAPTGCQLLRFELDTPNPATLAILTAKLHLDAIIIKGAKPQLRATIEGLTGALSVTS